MTRAVRTVVLAMMLAAGVAACASTQPLPQERDPTVLPPPANVGAAPDPAMVDRPVPPSKPTPAPPVKPGDVLVQPERPKPPPADADTRTASQRMDDIRAWDQCVMRAQGAFENPGAANPVASSPEEYCRARLGMSDRMAVPIKRQR